MPAVGPEAGCSTGRLAAAGLASLRFKRRDPGLERFIFFTREPCHVFDGFEFFALDDIQIAQKPLGLVAEQRLEFAAHALSNTGGIVHQPGNFVEKSIRCLHHVRLRNLRNPAAKCCA